MNAIPARRAISDAAWAKRFPLPDGAAPPGISAMSYRPGHGRTWTTVFPVVAADVTGCCGEAPFGGPPARCPRCYREVIA